MMYADPSYTSPMVHRAHTLSRDLSDRWIGGVCSGLARFTGWSTRLVRGLMVLSLLLPGPQVLFYLVAWIIMPARDM